MLNVCRTISVAQTSTRPFAIIPTTQPGPAAVDPSESILSEYTPEAPPNPTAPPYTLLRFNEDYHYLASPQNRTDVLDPLKYIPLNPDDSYSYLSFGGSVRERYEHYTNFGFGTFGQPSHDDYLLQRITLDADLHLNANVRFFFQGISGLQFGGEGSPPPVDQNGPDLQQAFADLKLDSSPDSPDYLIIRGGRFEMSYGSGRIVALRDGPNIPFKYDGLQLIGEENGEKIYAFITKPAQELRNAFDDEFPGQLFWGVYGTTRMLSQDLGLKADLYYFGYRNNQASYANGSGEEVRQTFGTRLFGAVHGFDYNIEPVIETGRFDNHDILAWTFASDVGYRFELAPAKPRLGLDFDVASGDTKHGAFGTFSAPYFNAGYFNDASVIRPSNIIDVHPTLELLPVASVLVVMGSDVLWRYTNNDGIYAPPGNVEIPPGGSSLYTATAADLSVQWEINRHLTWITSYSHFFTSDAVRRQGAKDIDYVGTWLSFTW